MCPLDCMCKVNTFQNINHTIEYDTCDWVRFSTILFVRQENMVYLDRRTWFFIKTREQKNMFYLLRQENRRTCFLLRQENMRTRGRVKACLSKKRTWGLVGLCPTLVVCVSSLKPLIFSLFTLHLTIGFFTFHFSLNHWILHSSFFTLLLTYGFFTLHFSLFT